jgi:hypothetical protein
MLDDGQATGRHRAGRSSTGITSPQCERRGELVVIGQYGWLIGWAPHAVSLSGEWIRFRIEAGTEAWITTERVT